MGIVCIPKCLPASSLTLVFAAPLREVPYKVDGTTSNQKITRECMWSGCPCPEMVITGGPKEVVQITWTASDRDTFRGTPYKP